MLKKTEKRKFKMAAKSLQPRSRGRHAFPNVQGITGLQFVWDPGFFNSDLTVHQGAGKDGRGNEPVGSCAMCDARSTGPRALAGKNC